MIGTRPYVSLVMPMLRYIQPYPLLVYSASECGVCGVLGIAMVDGGVPLLSASLVCFALAISTHIAITL